MKIAFVGNQGNNAYRLCKWIRKHGLDCHLYMLGDTNRRSFPEAVDRELEGTGYPEWIHRYDDRKKFWFLIRSASASEIENCYDIVVTSGFRGLIVARHLKNIPIVHEVLGSEVIRLPLMLTMPGATLSQRTGSFYYRSAIKRVNRMVSLMRPTVTSLNRLGQVEKLRLWGFPEDVVGNQKRVEQRLLGELNAKYEGYNRVFLWLSRLVYRNKTTHEYKGPERFLESYGRILKENKYKVCAVIGAHGPDAEAFKRLVRDKGLADHVEFVSHMPYWKLLTYLSIQNAVVFDEINLIKGELSGMARETLSVGGVLVKTLDKDLVEICYGPGCPIINAHDEQTCFEAMRKVLELKEAEFMALKEQNHMWAMENLHYPKAVERFIDILRETIYLFGAGK